MKLFNNPEIKKFTVIITLISILWGIAVVFISPVAAICVFSACAFLIISFLLFTKKRYERIDELSHTIDKILHGADSIDINAFNEGELSILESDVQKMLTRLRDQRDILEKEREYLADAIADISHQIRTPLTSINIILTLLRSGELTEEKRCELLMELSSLIARTENLVTVLLKISKIDAGTVKFEKKETDLLSVLRKACEPVTIPMDIKNQKLEIYSDNIKICCDFSWLVEAIGNIIKNSMEHTPENGIITVRASDTPIYTEIIISDTGNGFDEDDIPHIFERFYKGKNSSKDSFGIGLNLSEMIISSHNGTVKAQNRENGGAEFIIKLYKQVM